MNETNDDGTTALDYWFSGPVRRNAARFGEPESAVVVIPDGGDDAARVALEAAICSFAPGEEARTVPVTFFDAVTRQAKGPRALDAFRPAFRSLSGRRLVECRLADVCGRTPTGQPQPEGGARVRGDSWRTDFPGVADSMSRWHRDPNGGVPLLRVLWVGGRFTGGDLWLMSNARRAKRYPIPRGSLAAFNPRHVHRAGVVTSGHRLTIHYNLLFEALDDAPRVQRTRAARTAARKATGRKADRRTRRATRRMARALGASLP